VPFCGPPDISETTTARKLNLKMPLGLDMVKYPLWIEKLFYYTIQHEGGRHIDLRGRLRLTTVRRLSAYMSSRALAMTTASSL